MRRIINVRGNAYAGALYITGIGHIAVCDDKLIKQSVQTDGR